MLVLAQKSARTVPVKPQATSLERNFECAKQNQVPAAFCVAGHHSGVLNLGSKDDYNEGTLLARINHASRKRIPEYSAWEEEVTLPKFNFTTGESTLTGPTIKLKPTDILIMEGIHALNPLLTEKIPQEMKFKVYASALTSISIDENNSISTTDNRQLRRMVRDHNFRGYSAEQTIMRWASVTAGERENIFPFQENADIMFNSSLLYELPLLKFYAEPLLRRISPMSPAYAESLRLLNFLSRMVELNLEEQKAIPPTSVLREFIGGSAFIY